MDVAFDNYTKMYSYQVKELLYDWCCTKELTENKCYSNNNNNM